MRHATTTAAGSSKMAYAGPSVQYYAKHFETAYPAVMTFDAEHCYRVEECQDLLQNVDLITSLSCIDSP